MLSNSKITTGNISIRSKYNYGTLSRIGSTETLNSDETLGVKHNFSYLDVGTNGTTGLVSSIEFMKKDSGNWTSLNKKFSYEYDDVGNITDIKDISSNLIVHYEYDNLNQLTRENNTNLNKTITYSYDLGGNIQSKKIYAYTTDTDLSVLTPESTVVYGYSDSNWKDKMTSYGDDEIIYDAIGNPLVYRGGMQFGWSHGRRLDKASNQSYNVTYKYDDGGVRTSKTVNGTTTNFITSGIQVLAQKTGDNVLIWQVDGNGATVGFNYNGTEYFYLKNVQGDIAGITDASGNIVAEYVYDSWGKVLHVLDSNGTEITDSSNIAHINPFRYRGYYYDCELGLYYLNARYYDPETARFLNADGNLSGGFNLFAYCYDNPIMLSDWTGSIPTEVEAANMAEHIYNTSGTLSGGWTYIEKKSGGDNMVLGIYSRTVNNVTEYALVSKGTTMNSLKDWANNVQQFTTGSSTDGWASLEKAKEFVKDHSEEVTFIGHSKGGAEAVINAVATNKNCIVFNPLYLVWVLIN